MKILRKMMLAAGIVCAAVAAVTTNQVFADNVIVNPGGGGFSGCPAEYALSTCYGATWRWYPFENGQTQVEIPYAASYAQGGTVTNCDGEAGYWRYAMVASFGRYYNNIWYNAGDQVGLIGIDSNSDPLMDSTYLGGIMNYRAEGADWIYVKNLYNEQKKKYCDENGNNCKYGFDKVWDLGRADAISMFCAPQELTVGETAYASQSQASNRSSTQATSGVADWVKTSIVGANGSVVSRSAGTTYVTLDKNTKKGEAQVTFSHNVYATQKNVDIAWEVTRGVTRNINESKNDFENWGVYYIVEPLRQAGVSWGDTGYRTPGVGPGTVKSGTDLWDSKWYISTLDSRTFSDSESNYVIRDYYKITFSATGTYRFCETMAVGKDSSSLQRNTQVCTTVVVREDGKKEDSSTCPGQHYSNGTSAVISLVNNSRLNGDYGGWLGILNVAGEHVNKRDGNVTYAKPGDVVAWTNCYYPGAQSNASAQVVFINGSERGSEGEHDVEYNTSNSFVTFGDDARWDNKFTVTTTSPYGLNNNSLTQNSSRSTTKSLNRGDTTVTAINNNLLVIGPSDVSHTYDDYIKTEGNTPSQSSFWDDGVHGWTIWKYEIVDSGCDCWDDEDGGGCDCWEVWDWVPYYYSHTSGVTHGDYASDLLQSQSYVKVPYNFDNKASVSISGVTDSSLIYSGERFRVDLAQVEVKPKYNGLTEYEYATQVDNASVSLIAYTSTQGSGSAKTNVTGSLCGNLPVKASNGQCTELASTSGATLNSSGYAENPVYETNAINGTTFNGTYNAFDTNAGDYICVVMAVYPYTSGPADNLSESGDGTWYISAPSCKQVAKRPIFQVAGGSVYAAGSVQTGVNTKYNIFPAYSKNGAATTLFGSSVEQSVVARGLVRNLSSGAGTGIYNGGGASGNSSANNSNFCKYGTALSLANYSAELTGICPSVPASGNSGIVSATTNREALASYWVPASSDNWNIEAENETINLDTTDGKPVMSATGRVINYLYANGNLTLGQVNGVVNSVTVGLNTTRVVRADKNIVINQNIKYSEIDMTSAGSIPKMVIYAGGDVSIGCGVSEVDAIIIAEGTINTCNGYEISVNNANGVRTNVGEDVDTGDRSQTMLTVRGMLIANQFKFTRTYGAAMGSDSGVPAELINYDTSAILWGRYMAGSAESDTLTVTYQHELAPRY